MGSNGETIARWCAAALLIDERGRYLMQLRDDKPGILLPGHWALFGGTIDPGEDPARAIYRELEEELELKARAAEFFTELVIRLPMTPPRWDRMTFFTVPIAVGEIAAMVQHEGAGKALFSAKSLAQEERVAPWDLAVVMMHARRGGLFP